MNEASDKHQKFLNYLIEHQIFMTEELHDKFLGAQKALLSALTSYSVGKGTNHKLVREGQEELINNMQAALTKQKRPLKSAFATKKPSGHFPALVASRKGKFMQ